LEALSCGDKVIATTRGRSFSKLSDLKEKGAAILELDVTDSIDTLKKAAKEALGMYGRVDVVVNNAGAFDSRHWDEITKPEGQYWRQISGYILTGTVEETTPDETLQQFKYVENRYSGITISATET